MAVDPAPGPRPGERTQAIAPPSGPPDPLPRSDRSVPAFISDLRGALPTAILQLSVWVGDWTLIVQRSRIADVAGALRDSGAAAFDFCSDVTAVDWPPRPERFDVVYSLYSTVHRHRVRLKVRVPDGESVPTVSHVWPAANWLEREVFDMFGIVFDGHPDLRRILMPDDWQGHPERKDYPLEGPGELLIESPTDWLRARRDRDIE